MEACIKDATQVPRVGATMPRPGDILADKYRIEAVAGRGGMSVVYRASHLELDQLVAIKVLSADAVRIPEYVVRLRREARVVSQIRSDHVVRVHDLGELPNGGVPYLVMEYLTGLDLAAVLARGGPLPVTLAIECIMQCCEALAAAHAVGIIHRDLKPANLFLTETVDGSPCVKLLDFGISRTARRHGLSPLTDPGTVLGTPSYMAPEQMEAAEGVDARSDIWALGAILYELLVGKPPFNGDSLPQIFLKIMRSKTPRPSSHRKEVPPALDAVVGRCLMIESEDRYQSVAELAWALSTATGGANARDSAARISRVFEKRVKTLALEAKAQGAPCPPPAPVARRGRPLRGRATSTPQVVLAVVGTVLLCAASAFGVFAARGSTDASAPPEPERAAKGVAPAHADEAQGRAATAPPAPEPSQPSKGSSVTNRAVAAVPVGKPSEVPTLPADHD